MTEQFINPDVYSISNLFNSNAFIVPVYQRPYSWGDKQINSFLEDSYKSFEAYCNNANKDSPTLDINSILFAGTIYLRLSSIRSNKNIYDVVDGQQRITTCVLLLVAILNRLYAFDDDNSKDVVTILRSLLWKKTKEFPVLELGSIESAFFKELMNELYDRKNVIGWLNGNKNHLNHAEERIFNNLRTIDVFLDKNGITTAETLCSFLDFVTSNIKVIGIMITTSMSKMFEYFESINGKGKKLEEIDLIKSYLFQNIKETDYEDYLNKWGKLTISTNDNLMDYLTVYIRGCISFSEKGLKKDKVKKLIESSLKSYFKTSTIEETVKKFIDDLTEKVNYYRFIKNIDNAVRDCEPIKTSNILKSYLLLSCYCGYGNDKPMQFKSMLLFKDGKCNIQDLEKLFQITFVYILTFQTIANKESKNTSKLLRTIQNKLLKNNELNAELVSEIDYLLKKSIQDNAINNDLIRKLIPQNLCYTNRDVTKAVLSFINFFDEETRETDYNKLFIFLAQLWNIVQVDHILPRNPDKDSQFKYWSTNKETKVYLKEGQDFYKSDELVHEYYEKDLFEKEKLHPIGNLRLEYGQDNISKGNQLIELKDLGNQKISTYTQILERQSALVETILNSRIVLTSDSIGEITPPVHKTMIIEITNRSHLMGDLDNITKNSNVISFIYKTEKYNLDKHTYVNLLETVLKLIYKFCPQKLAKLAEQNYKPFGDRIGLSSNQENIKIKCAVIADNIYLETNYSGAYCVKLLYAILGEIDENPDDLMINVSPESLT